MTNRAPRLDKALTDSGMYAKVARRHYRRDDGVEIKYDCNRWCWVVSTKPRQGWKTLYVAVLEAHGGTIPAQIELFA